MGLKCMTYTQQKTNTNICLNSSSSFPSSRINDSVCFCNKSEYFQAHCLLAPSTWGTPPPGVQTVMSLTCLCLKSAIPSHDRVGLAHYVSFFILPRSILEQPLPTYQADLNWIKWCNHRACSVEECVTKQHYYSSDDCPALAQLLPGFWGVLHFCRCRLIAISFFTV